MLPEKKKKMLFIIIAVIAVIIVIIIMYNLAKYMKNHSERPEVVYDDPYPTVYDYYAVEYSDEGTYKIIGFDNNFIRNDLNLRIFYSTNSLYWRNNHLAFYSDAINELRYNSKEEKYFLYELDTYYNNSVDIKIIDDYLIMIENNTLSYRKINSDEEIEITNQLISPDVVFNNHLVYYVINAGIYEYNLETNSSKLITIREVNEDQKLLAITNRFLIFQSDDEIYYYTFKTKSTKNLNEKADEEEGTSIKFVGLFNATIVYQVEKDGEYNLRTFSLEIDGNTYQDFSLGYEQINYAYAINEKYLYAELIIKDKERYVLIDIKDKKVLKDLDYRYKLILEVKEDE